MSEQDRFAEVAVDAPAGNDRTYSYAIPEGMEPLPGQFVVVPFGPRQVQGIVFELADHPQVEAVRPIRSVEGSAPVLSEVNLGLARWVSQYYACSLFEAAAPMLPPGGRFRIKSYFEAVPEPSSPPSCPHTGSACSTSSGRRALWRRGASGGSSVSLRRSPHAGWRVRDS